LKHSTSHRTSINATAKSPPLNARRTASAATIQLESISVDVLRQIRAFGLDAGETVDLRKVFAIALLGWTLLTGCTASRPAYPLATYREALAATDPSRMPGVASGPAAESAAVDRFVDFYKVFSAEMIRAKSTTSTPRTPTSVTPSTRSEGSPRSKRTS
jgi:hypothetical protein